MIAVLAVRLPRVFIALVVLSAVTRAQTTGVWTLQNGIIRKSVAVTKDHGLETVEWTDLSLSHNFSSSKYPRACNEFQVRVDDKTVSGRASDVTLAGTRQHTAPDGTSLLDLTFTARRAPVRITVHYELAKAQPAVRQWLSIENTGSTAVTLRHLTVACGVLAPGPENELIAFGGYGEQPRETYFTGRVNDVAVLLEDAKTGIGWAVLSEVPGYLKRTELGQVGQWSPSFAAMYDTDLFPFERSLTPGETFTTAAVSVLSYQRGTAADPHWRIASYVRDAIAHNKQSQPPPWIYNTWEPFRRKLGASQLVSIANTAAADGLNLLSIDDGWEKKFGENQIDPVNFPGGLEPVFAHADGQNLNRGLWSSVALVSTSSRDYVDHPEWACRGRDGQPYLSNGEGVVMCLASSYKYAVIDRLSDLIRRYQLSYIKLDLTTVFNTYGEEPGCFEEGHEHKSAHESSARTYEALGFIAETLHSRFPSLLIDYTFELWGEKHLIDYGLLHVADLDWLSNIRDQDSSEAGPLQARTLLYQRALAIPVESLLIGNLQAETGSWQEHVATAMASGPVFLGDLTKQTPADTQHFRDWITRYTTLRSQVRLTDSFFPLGAWRQPRIDQWDGYARLSRNGEGLIALFANQSSEDAAKFSIPGFPDGSFTLKPWTGEAVSHVEGKTVREGLSVPLAAGQKVTILEIRATR